MRLEPDERFPSVDVDIPSIAELRGDGEEFTYTFTFDPPPDFTWRVTGYEDVEGDPSRVRMKVAGQDADSIAVTVITLERALFPTLPAIGETITMTLE